MNNFILNLLGIEDDNVIIDDFFNENETNTLVVSVSQKRKQEVCPKCGSINNHVHSHNTKKINHSNFTTKKCILLFNQKRLKCNDCKR